MSQRPRPRQSQPNEPRRESLDRKCDPRPPRPPMDQAQRQMAADNIPLARALARPFKRQSPADTEDLDAAALLALCQAARTWVATLGVPFGAFARRRILGALTDAARASLRRGLAGDGGCGVPSVANLDHEPEDVCRDDDGADADDAGRGPGFDAMMLRLPGRTRDVCRALYESGLSRSEAGAALGVSKSTVAREHERALRTLRAAGGF